MPHFLHSRSSQGDQLSELSKMESDARTSAAASCRSEAVAGLFVTQCLLHHWENRAAPLMKDQLLKYADILQSYHALKELL